MSASIRSVRFSLSSCVASRLKETTFGTERDSVWLLDEETGQPVEVPLTAVAHEMTPLNVAMPTSLCGSSEKVGDEPSESLYKEETVRDAGRSQLVFCELVKDLLPLTDLKHTHPLSSGIFTFFS